MRWIIAASTAVLLALTASYSDFRSAEGRQVAPVVEAEYVPSPSANAVQSAPRPPVAIIKRKVFKEYGRQRTDNYYWLKERKNPEVVAYLKAENAYADAILAPLKPLAAALQAEMLSCLDDAVARVPFADNGYVYQIRYDKSADYPLIERHKSTAAAPVEVVLDVAKLATGHAQFILNNWVVSPDGSRVAYAVDFAGNNDHRVFVRSILTGRNIGAAIEGADEDLVFSTDGKFLFYTKGAQVWRHAIGANPKTDVLVYQEKDETFGLTLSLAKSRKFILIAADHTTTSEVRYLAADKPTGKFRVIEPRRRRVRYYVDHVGDKFFILTNRQAPDFQVAVAPQKTPGATNWKTLIAERHGHYISDIEVFERYVAIEQIHDAISSLRVVRLFDMRDTVVERPTEIGVASFEDSLNLDPSSKTLQFAFEGPLQPKTIYELDMDAGGTTRVHQCLPADRFDRGKYAAKLIQATAADGETIPITIVYRPDLLKAGGNPTFITGYGAYGDSSLPRFLTSWYRLINRGFIFAIAHVRGGREMGQRWYEQGRLLSKKNTFTDFIAATETLIAQGYSDPKNIFARGASAGGLLMGAIANLRPDLYAGIVAEVPFVDVITSMSDPTVPLTTFEYEEWGNPAIKTQYDYMRSYSPYDNVAAKGYPSMFVTAGFYDAQVAYSEAAKWVAKLRAMKTDNNEFLFMIDMDSGHRGDSGRLRWLEQQALIIAWVLSRVR